MSKNLKIEYGSPHEFFELFKEHPADLEEAYKELAESERALDTATMDLEILTAEIIDEVCKKRYSENAPATAKQEIRRAEVQLDGRWKKTKKKVITASANALILKGRMQGMWSRGNALKMLAQAEMKIMYIEPVVYRDNRNPDTKSNNLEGHLELPE